MKKMLTLGLVLALMMMFSFGVMADDPDPVTPGVDDPDWTLNAEGGIFENYEAFKTFFDSRAALSTNGPNDLEYKTITNAKITGTMSDIEYYPGNQDGSVKIKTLANIPCYLEMELIGNAGNSKIKSMGSNSTGELDRTDESHWMFFDTNYGGFVDSDWESIGTGDVFSDVGPNMNGRDIYIQACDMWTANLFANIDYGFSVSATPLVNGSNSLDIEMRHTELNVPGWTEAGVLPTAEPVSSNGWDYQVGNWTALNSSTVYMQFRVPYDLVPAGAYAGDITFKVYSM